MNVKRMFGTLRGLRGLKFGGAELIRLNRGVVTTMRKIHECQRRDYTTQHLNLNEFHDLADHVLENILEKLSPVEDAVEDIDITYAQGVLKLDLGSKGIWVINKQTPNRQLWWSSPISGPLRFEYGQNDENKTGWYITRENQNGSRIDIISLLSSEMKTVIGKDLVSR